MFTYYHILGLEPDASQADIKQAARTTAKAFHPDLHQGCPFHARTFRLSRKAAETLSNTTTRAAYDRKLAALKSTPTLPPNTHRAAHYQGSPIKINSEWGVRITCPSHYEALDVAPGDLVEVTTKNGKQWTSTIASIVSTLGTTVIATTD